MARKVNKRLVGWLTAFAVVVTTMLGVVMVKSLEQTDPAHYVSQAERRAADEDWAQARMYYHRAYQISQDPRYLLRAGEMSYRQGEEYLAERYWNDALTVDPSLIEAHEKILDLSTEVAQLYRGAAAWRRVEQRSRALLDVAPDNAKGEQALGLAMIELAQVEADPGKKADLEQQGLGHITRAVELEPGNINYALTQASQAHRTEHFQEAEGILVRLRESHTEPGDDAARVRLAYGRFLATRGRTDEAVELFAEAESFAGANSETQARVKSEHAQYWVARWVDLSREAAQASEARDAYDRATELLRASIAIDETVFLPYMLLAELQSARGEHLAAIETCERRINQSIRREGIHARERKYSMYMLLIRAGEECLAHAATLERTDPNYEQMIARAEQSALSAAAEFADRGPGLNLQARIQLARGDELAAIERLQRAATAYGAPNWRNDHLLATLLLRNNQPGAARDAITRALRDPAAEPACWVTFAQVSLRTEEYQLAAQAADEALRRSPDQSQALRIKAAALTRLGRGAEANDILARLGGEPTDKLLQAHILFESEQFSEAAALLEELLEADPAHTGYLRLAIAALDRIERHDRAAQLVERARRVAADDVTVQLLEVEVDRGLSDEQRKAAQAEILQNIADPFKRHYELAMWHHRQEDRSGYRRHLDEAERLLDASDYTADPAARRSYLRDIVERQFVLAAADKDQERVEHYAEWAAKENLDGADGLTYRGRAHMVNGDIEAAISSFSAAIERQPTDAAALTWLGQCQMALDPPQVLEARESFERATGANPRIGLAQKGLARIALYQGDQEELAFRLQQCARLLPEDPWVKDQLLALRERDAPDEGIRRRLEIRAAEPENVENLIRLGQLYARTNDNDRAEECFRAALDLPDADERAVLAAVSLFHELGRHDQALAIIEDRIERADAPRSKAYAFILLADHWDRLGDPAQAEAALHRAAQTEENLRVCVAFAELKSRQQEYGPALEWYDRAIALADGRSQALVARLRRGRIDVLLRAGGPDGAQREIEAYLRDYPGDSEGLLLVAASEARQGDIDAAIGSITRYLDVNRTSKHALFQRARLYNALGRVQPAIADLETLRSLDPGYNNYEARLLLADTYTLTSQLDLAYAELESILRDDPAAKEVAVHLIALYEAHGRYGDAIRVCTRLTNLYPSEAVWLKKRADLKMKLTGPRDALGDYEAAARLANYHPHYTASVLTTLGLLNSIQQGIDYYEQTIPPDKRAPRVKSAYADLLGRSEQTERAGQLFLEALSQSGFADVGLVQVVADDVIQSIGLEKAIEQLRDQSQDPQLERATRHLLSVLLTRSGQHSEALAITESLLASAADDREKVLLLAARGNLHEYQDQWEPAHQDYERLLQLDDRNVIGLNNLAFLLSDKLGRPADAIPYARRAAALSQSPTVHDTLAWTLVQLGQYDEAIAILTRVLERNPTFIIGIHHLAEAYRRSGGFSKAGAVLTGAENLLAEGVGTDLAEQIRECRANIAAGKMEP